MKNILLILLVPLAGCAGVTISPLDGEGPSGVCFYAPEPYLLVSYVAPTKPDGTLGTPSLTSTIVYLPNPAKGSVMKIHSGWGTANSSISLTNGWMLSSLGSQTDSKSVETMAAAGSLGLSTFPLIKPFLMGAAKGDSGTLSPGLYHINIDAKSGLVKSLDRISQ